MSGRRILVCGGRTYGSVPPLTSPEEHPAAMRKAEEEKALLFTTLDRLHGETPIAVLIEGGATGADRRAAAWARYRGVEVASYPAEWRKHGKAAGPIRNARMLTEGRPDLVVAFKGTNGTLDCVRQAEAAGIPVVRIDW